MKSKLLALLLLAGSSVFAAPGVFVGVRIGGGYYAPPPPPAPVVSYVAPAPAPGLVWVGGYYNWVGSRYYWHQGYWAHPPYYGARWVAPRYYGHRYYGGHWRR